MKILVIGAGQIGSRHIQALAAMPGELEVVVADPSEESRARAEGRWRDVPGHAEKHLTMLAQSPKDGDFAAAVVATSAIGRLAHFETLARLDVKHVLAEKLLFQSIADLEAGTVLAARHGMAIHTNYVYRYAAPWGALRARLAGQEFGMSVVAGDIGLTTNLPHWLDLFEYLADARLASLDVVASRIYGSKRGGDLLECAGRVKGEAANGSRFALDFSAGSAAPLCRIDTPEGWISLNEANNTLTGPLADSGWAFETPMVSRITTRAIPDILGGRTPLPVLAETAPMNRLLLQGLGHAFGITGPGTIIPVT